MSLTFSNTTSNALLIKLIELIDSGTQRPNAYIEVYTGPRPATPDDPITSQLKLATLQLSGGVDEPSFNQPQNGVATANPIASETNAPGSGPASWFRMYNKDNIPVLDGLITSTTDGTGNIQFESVDVVQGGTVGLTSCTLKAPRTLV